MCGKALCNLHNKKNYVILIKYLKLALDHGLILETVHRVIEFNQEEWLNLYIDVNTKLRAKAKKNFEKVIFKLMNNSVFGKTTENTWKHRDIILVTTNRGRSHLVSASNYHATKSFLENLLATEMNKAKAKIERRCI